MGVLTLTSQLASIEDVLLDDDLAKQWSEYKGKCTKKEDTEKELIAEAMEIIPSNQFMCPLCGDNDGYYESYY